MPVVLVVDDSEFDRARASRLLARSGWEVHLADNGPSALELLAENSVDLVVSDLMMPEMNGLDLLERVRTKDNNPPVIIVTAQGSEDLAVKALQRGAAGYVAKDRLASELSEMAQSVLDACSFEQLQSQILQVHGELKLRFMLPNDLKKIAGVVKYIQSRVSEFRLFKRNETVLIGVAIQEMTSNAIIHGNLGVSSSLRDSEDGSYEKLIAERQLTSPYEDRRVEIQVTMDGDHAVFEISDEGDGFDVNSLPDPCDPENIGRVHGRGVFMTRSFMDDVSYNDVGNLVRMEKRASNNDAP